MAKCHTITELQKYNLQSGPTYFPIGCTLCILPKCNKVSETGLGKYNNMINFITIFTQPMTLYNQTYQFTSDMSGDTFLFLVTWNMLYVTGLSITSNYPWSSYLCWHIEPFAPKKGTKCEQHFYILRMTYIKLKHSNWLGPFGYMIWYNS